MLTQETAKQWVENRMYVSVGDLIEDLKTIYGLNEDKAQLVIDSVIRNKVEKLIPKYW